MAREITIIRGAIAPDHVHMLISAPPSLAPAKIVIDEEGCERAAIIFGFRRKVF
jgi:REP element-mobilizing transposase RayT